MEGAAISVPDEELPEDLQPTDDNPLAQPAGEDVPDDVVTEGSGPGFGGQLGGRPGIGNGDVSEASSSGGLRGPPTSDDS